MPESIQHIPMQKSDLNKNFSGTYWYYLHFKAVDIKNNK